MSHSRIIATVAGVLLLAFTGCSLPSSAPDLVYLPDQVQPTPIAGMPEEMRIKNWVGRGAGGHSGGSCVHASTINTFRAVGRLDLEKRWYEERDRGYEGPETGNGIISKFKTQQIPHVYTESADTKLLDAATGTHRPGIIFYYPSHCVNFVEFAHVDGRDVAVLLDNNFPDRYIVIDRDVFEKSWRYYGGFALIPWIEPVTPRTYPRTFQRS